MVLQRPIRRAVRRSARLDCTRRVRARLGQDALLAGDARRSRAGLELGQRRQHPGGLAHLEPIVRAHRYAARSRATVEQAGGARGHVASSATARGRVQRRARCGSSALDTAPPSGEGSGSTRPPPRAVGQHVGDPINPKHTFPNFVVGPSNELAHAAAVASAGGAGPATTRSSSAAAPGSARRT